MLPFLPELVQLQWNADSKITHAKVPDTPLGVRNGTETLT